MTVSFLHTVQMKPRRAILGSLNLHWLDTILSCYPTTMARHP